MANPEVGNFVTIQVVMPEHVQPGAILAIRRNTEILGRVKVSEVTGEGAIASPMPGFGQVAPQQGDELIIPPQFEGSEFPQKTTAGRLSPGWPKFHGLTSNHISETPLSAGSRVTD